MSEVVSLIFLFVVVAVLINFVNLVAGVLAAVTGRSHAPDALLRLRRNVAASAGDQRMLGMTLVLLSVGQLQMLAALLVIVTLAAAQSSGGHAPITGLYLVALVGFLGSVACTFGSLALGRGVRYKSREPRVSARERRRGAVEHRGEERRKVSAE